MRSDPAPPPPPDGPAWATGAPEALTTAPTQLLEDAVGPIEEAWGSSRTHVTNWGGTFTASAARAFSPTSVAQCLALVELARRADVELRAVGSAHSPSDIMLTGRSVRGSPVPPPPSSSSSSPPPTPPVPRSHSAGNAPAGPTGSSFGPSLPRAARRTHQGWLLRMDHLVGLVSASASDPVSSLFPAPSPATQPTTETSETRTNPPGPPSIEVLSGTQVHDVHKYLATAGPAPLALSSVGSISDQTIGGLLSTCTHGSGLEYPLVGAYVLELTLIVPLARDQGGTQLIHCSRTDRPELFNAALCGLGAMGLITHVKIAAEPAFQLHQIAEEARFDLIFGQATGFPAAPASNAAGEGSQSHGDSVGALLAAGRRLPRRSDLSSSIAGRQRSKGPDYIFPFVPDHDQPEDVPESYTQTNHNLGEELLDEETHKAQARFEALARCTQHLRIFWYPQIGTVSILRADRTKHAPESASFLSRLYGKLVGHNVTEAILYISRFHRHLPITAVKLWYWLTHKRLPSDAPHSLDDTLTFARTSQDKPALPIVAPSPRSSTPSITLGGPLGGQAELDTDMASFARPSGTAATAARQAEAYSAFHDAVIPALSEGAHSTTNLPGWITPRDKLEHALPLHPAHPTTWSTDVSHRIFNMDCLFAQYTAEWAIPLTYSAAALRAMRDWLAIEHSSPEGARLHWPVEVRVGPADGVWLSNSYGRYSTYIGIVLYRPYGKNVPYRNAFAKFDALMRHYAGRPHWAKQHPLSHENLARLYPHFEDWRRLRAQADPDQVFVNPYIRRHILGQEVNDAISPRVFKARL